MIPRPVLAMIAGCMMLAATFDTFIIGSSNRFAHAAVAGFVYGAITAITQEVWPDL